MSIFKTLMDNALQEITPAEAPYLHAALDDLCKKAGLPKPLLCQARLRLDNKLNPLMKFDSTAAAIDVDEPRVIVGRTFRSLMGHHRLDAPISEEIKSVLAHELGHIQQKDAQLLRGLPKAISPFAGMAAAMVGMAIYEHIHTSTPAHLDEANAKEYQNQQLDALLEAEKAHHPHAGNAMVVVKYAAAGALGLISGTIASKLMHNHIEFRADRISAQLMGSGKPLANALESLSAKFKEMQPNHKPFNPVQEIKKWMRHPALDERVHRLRAM